MSRSDSNHKPQPGVRESLRERYEQLWRVGLGLIRAGKADVDPVLRAGLPDRRRGLTVIARPSPAVRQRVRAFLRELRNLEPDQYYYRPSEFHLTVLSLFTASINAGPFFARAEDYVSALDVALRKVMAFRTEFEGVTVSSGTVMIQGFFDNATLNHLRDKLRYQLRSVGLAGGLDQRYRLETAHMTVARFRAPLRDRGRFAAALERARQKPFGATRIASLSLVKNDWYMTHETLETWKRYRLSARTGS